MNYPDPFQATIKRVLVSSPCDVSRERRLAGSVIDRFNRIWFEERHIFLKIVKYEDFPSLVGPGVQPAINRMIDYESIDICIGVMWNRFGSPTSTNESGTAEEFAFALEHWKKSRKPWIAFYFSKQPSLLVSEAELIQRGKVLRFQSRIQTLGISREYSETRDFAQILYQDLVRITQQIRDSHQ